MSLSADNLLINSDTVISASDTTYDGHIVTINGATVTIEGFHTFAELHLINSAVLTHAPAVEGQHVGIDVTANTIVIDKNSKIDVTGKGYLPNSSISTSGSGSHGGAAGAAEGRTTNPLYGSLHEPQAFGIGGRNGSSPDGDEKNRRGGGAIKIIADTLTVDGTIAADGLDRSSGIDGAGAGGSIWLNVGL
ncbi:hypothetical protein, partial [Simiduia curdlanivorans]